MARYASMLNSYCSEMISYAWIYLIFVAWLCVATLNRQTRQNYQTQTKQINAMKKNFSKLTLKTDKIVSLSKSQAQGILAGAKPKTGKTCGADNTCWCND
jgi:hypothetical protein